MQKAIWALTIVCALSTIVLTTAITHADPPLAEPDIVKARAFVLVNKKGETMATLYGETPMGAGQGLMIHLGQEDQAAICFTRAPAGDVIINATDGRGKACMDLYLEINGSSTFALSNKKAGMSNVLGNSLLGPHLIFNNDDGKVLTLDTRDGLRLPRIPDKAPTTTKPS